MVIRSSRRSNQIQQLMCIKMMACLATKVNMYGIADGKTDEISFTLFKMSVVPLDTLN